jgi:similar to spore coat protein
MGGVNMGIMDELLGTGANAALKDKDIAFDMIKDSKFGLTSLTLALAEATNPELRRMLTEQLNTCIAEHHRLSDIAINKDWYKAYAAPMEQIRYDFQDAQNVTS